MTKREIQDQHDADVKQALASTLDAWLKEVDLTADYSDARILEALVHCPASAYLVQERWSQVKPEDVDDQEYYPGPALDVRTAIASVLYWYVTTNQATPLNTLSLACFGSVPFLAYGTFLTLATINENAQAHHDRLLDASNLNDASRVRLDKAIKGMPQF